MRFQILSHAGLRVNAGGKELICDPWLLGSCYWRSWWNLPPVSPELIAGLKPDVIYLTHIHWDHFHGPSLKLFPRDTRIVIPYDRYDRIRRDLVSIGFENIVELKHGQTFEIAPGFTIQSYHIAPVILDSAVVIKADGVTMLNASDAKFAGPPLNQILRDHPKIDFALRSHSSANARACYHIIGREDELLDDTEHYLRAFSLFMNRVKPRYALPFASNHCHLHQDTLEYNPLAQSPRRVVEYFERFRAEQGLATEIKAMFSGDSFDGATGAFDLTPHPELDDREAFIAGYGADKQASLAAYYAREDRLKPDRATVERLVAEARACALPSHRKRLDFEMLLVAYAGGWKRGYAMNVAKGTVRDVAEADFPAFTVRIEIPELILRQAVALNMFHHAEVSKRLRFYASEADMPRLQLLVDILTLKEAEVLPLRKLFTPRAFAAALPRWREALLYARVLVMRAKGISYSDIEEELLAIPGQPAPPRRSGRQPRQGRVGHAEHVHPT